MTTHWVFKRGEGGEAAYSHLQKGLQSFRAKREIFIPNVRHVILSEERNIFNDDIAVISSEARNLLLNEMFIKYSEARNILNF